MSSEQKVSFDEKIKQLRSSQGKKVKMFFWSRISHFHSKHKDMKSPRYRMVPGDFYLMVKVQNFASWEKWNKITLCYVFPPGNDIKWLELSFELNNNHHHMWK